MTEIKGTTSVCGLIGNPVAHSISPLIHNSLAAFCDVDLAYVTFQVQQEAVADAIQGAYALDIKGLNVTVPHKQAVLGKLSDIDPLAKAIGAVNTLVRTGNGYKGYNTDITGLARQLEEAGIALAGQEVIILGAGGAARAIAFLCASEGAKSVYLLNRTVEKAQQIAQDVNQNLQTDTVGAMPVSDYVNLPGRDYIVLQTTSVGLAPNQDAAVIENADFYRRAAVGVDIIYNPAETRFMKLMKAQGKPAYNGLKMLLYQGVAAFELWNQLKVPQEAVNEVYKRMKKELGIVE